VDISLIVIVVTISIVTRVHESSYLVLNCYNYNTVTSGRVRLNKAEHRFDYRPLPIKLQEIYCIRGGGVSTSPPVGDVLRLVQMSDSRLSESYGHDEEEKRFDELDN
jgi:hypothetical protein